MGGDYRHVDHPALAEFARLAEEFCAIVDRRGELSRAEFLRLVHAVLPRLYAAALALPSTDVLMDAPERKPLPAQPETEPDWWRPDRDRALWSTVYKDLNVLIGDLDHYREVLDPYDPPEEKPIVGSLADDIADIHCDLRDGLRKWRRGETGEAFWAWRGVFEIHWGEHAVGALRALHFLARAERIDWPAADPPTT